MSETVHYKGIATKIQSSSIEDLKEFAKNELYLRNKSDKITYYKDEIECLCNIYDSEYFFHEKTKTLYEITKENIDLDEEIIKANVLENQRIEYELRYYNGGAGFEECLNEALDALP